MRFHTDPTDTITVEENVHPLYGVRSVRARINDDTGTSLDLYQSGTTFLRASGFTSIRITVAA